MSLTRLLIISYLITIIAEVPSGFFWGVRKKADFILLICVNTITNPLVVLLSWYLNTHMVIWDAKLCLFIVELAVVVVEGLLFGKLVRSISHPFGYSAQANALSFAAGIFLSMFVL